ncbi:MAG TPA: trypsin-like peptidase domain-containing protein [Planctomycetota bacterium]|nr:trypsin-like peptidase domain-containing protein [Planctomycetota bacterium]
MRNLGCAIALSSSLMLAAAAGEDAVEFKLIDVGAPYTTACFTEDGAQLIVGLCKSNTVSVLDTKTGEKIKTIETPMPIHLIVRGNQLLVVNYGKGVISVYSTKTWKLENEVLSGSPETRYITAPQGKYYKQQVVVTNVDVPYLVDLAKDTFKKSRVFPSLSAATLSYNGENLICQSMWDHSPSGTVTDFDFPKYMDDSGMRGARGEHRDTPWLRQAYDNALWYGGGAVYSGFPPMPLKVLGTAVTFDLTRPLAYVFQQKEGNWEARRADATLELVGSRKIVVPKELSFASHRDRIGNILADPMAVTLDNELCIYMPALNFQGFAFAKMPAFPGAPVQTPGTESPPRPVAGAENFPAKISSGKLFEYRLYAYKVDGKFDVMAGPLGIKISAQGVLTWTPGANDVGVQSIKIRATIGENVSFLRISTEVISEDLVKRAGGDLGRVADLGVQIVNSPEPRLEYGLGAANMLLLDGKELRVLDADGLLVTAHVSFERKYARILERPDYFVGLSDRTLDFLNKKSGERIKSIDLKCNGTYDMALDPGSDTCWVTLVDPSAPQEQRILAQHLAAVNEKTGAVSVFPDAYGQWVVIHPNGRWIYTSTKEFINNSTTLVDQWGPIGTYGDNINIDVLMCYDVSAGKPKLQQINKSPGANGQALRISPDGKSVSYVAGGGYRAGAAGFNGYTVPAFDPEDIRLAHAAYDVGECPRNVAYHPVLPLVACSATDAFHIYNRDNREKLENRVDRQIEKKTHEIRQLLFSPGGRHLLVSYQDAKDRHVVRAFPLVLDEKELKALSAPRNAIQPIKRTGLNEMTPKLKLEDFDVLKSKPASGKMELKDIAREFQSSVALIRSDDRSATGFFVGSSGLLLTCAHALPVLGTVEIQYASDSDKKVLKSKEVTVLKIDRDNDLALLQVQVKGKVRAVRFGAREAEAGESVCIIGNPGAEGTVFENTLTQGVVSTSKRSVAGKDYIQTSASVNHGSSGSPVFDASANVIGMVQLKAMPLEGVGFALPVEPLKQFLRSAIEK